MRKARSVTRAAPLLGALSFALLLVGCSDDAAPPTSIKNAPTGAVATRAIDLTRRPDLRATVKTVATFRSKDGKILKKEFSQKVKATFKKGLARTTREGPASADGASATFASLAPGAAQFAQFTSGDGTYTPVIAAVSGTLANDYYDSQTDSVGNVYEVYGWAADLYSPPTDVWAYRNGILIAQLHAAWTPVSGGHVLASQQLGSFYQDGALAASIVSTVSGGGGGGDCSTTEEGCILMTENDESFGAKVAAPMFAALDKVGCWLGPKAAYAAVQCFGVTSVFVGETFVLGAATWVGGPYAAEAVMAAAWWVGWPLWTHAMYEMLACFDSRGEQIVRRGRTRCGANPRASGCGGGGGGGAGF